MPRHQLPTHVGELTRAAVSTDRKLLPLRVSKSVPTTLCVIGALTAVGLAFENCQECDDCAGCIEKTELGASLESFSGTLHVALPSCAFG